jgi:hypothetical protein
LGLGLEPSGRKDEGSCKEKEKLKKEKREKKNLNPIFFQGKGKVLSGSRGKKFRVPVKVFRPRRKNSRVEDFQGLGGGGRNFPGLGFCSPRLGTYSL